MKDEPMATMDPWVNRDRTATKTVAARPRRSAML